MVVPQKRNHRGGLVSREPVGKHGRRGGLIRLFGRRREPSRRRPAAHATSVRRVRRSPAVYVAAPMSAMTTAATTTRPPRRGNTNRAGETHQPDFVMPRTPPRHPPKSRQCRSQGRAGERFEARSDGVARVLTKASDQLARQPRTCRQIYACGGAPRTRPSGVFATRPIGSSALSKAPSPCGYGRPPRTQRDRPLPVASS